MNALRQSLIDAIDQLHPLLNTNIPEHEKNQIREKAQILYDMLETVVEKEREIINRNFETAIIALEGAANSAKKSKKDVEKIADTIKKTSQAIAVLEKLLKAGVGFA
ncbi:MAG: hypothetical protein OEZ68_16110 [Gammaproteobacteria bacterium]|nr:hypothetical protein [Gammaproteobacteria bacterium]MDH5802327.1 hypothetical protein [Gammaproteobacteria bacterium]